MTSPLRLRIHVSEPFDFERENDSADLFGTTLDHGRDTNEWEIELEVRYRFNERNYDAMLIGPRYVGEHLGKVHDALLGVPVRIAHRTRGGWHYAMTGMISLAPPLPEPEPDIAPEPEPNDDDDNDTLDDRKLH